MDIAGHNYGGAYAGGPSAYQHSRRTLNPATAGLPYLPSLQRCVATIERSTQLLKSTVAVLDEATNGYPRLKTITAHTKRFELVSEQDIANAQVEVAKDVEPQLFGLTEKVAQTVLDLEAKEYQLMQTLHRAEEKQKEQVQRQRAARSGLSNIKKLQSLTRRKEELSRSAMELDEVLDQKCQEFSRVMERIGSMETKSGQLGAAKRLRRNPTNESRELALKEEERRREVVRRDQELEAMQKKIEERRRTLQELAQRRGAQNSNTTKEDGFNPSIPWTMYSGHYSSLEKALQTELKVDSRDKDVYEEAFGRLAASYLRELDSRQGKTDKELSNLTREKTRKLSQMRNLCRQLFPEDNIGQTMVKVLELLGESSHSEIYYKDLVQSEFPPEEERRHNLGRVVSILKQIGVIELVLETREDRNSNSGSEDEDQQGISRPEEQLLLRIKFEE